MYQQGDLLVCYWYDAEDEAKWQSISDIEKETIPLCKTVGWYLSADDRCVRLLFCISGVEDKEELEAGRCLIPKAMIRNIEIIREDELSVE